MDLNLKCFCLLCILKCRICQRCQASLPVYLYQMYRSCDCVLESMDDGSLCWTDTESTISQGGFFFWRQPVLLPVDLAYQRTDTATLQFLVISFHLSVQ